MFRINNYKIKVIILTIITLTSTKINNLHKFIYLDIEKI